MGIWRNKKRILSVIHFALSFLFFFSSSEKPLTVDISPGSWVAAQVGDSVVLTCAVVGCDSPTFSWRTQINGSLNGEVRQSGATSTLTLSPVSFENENSYLCTVTCARRILEKEIQVEVYCKCFSKWMSHWLLPVPLVPLEEKGCDCVRKSIYVERDLASLDLWTLVDAIQSVQLSGIYRICLQHTLCGWAYSPRTLEHAPCSASPHCHMYVMHGGGERAVRALCLPHLHRLGVRLQPAFCFISFCFEMGGDRMLGLIHARRALRHWVIASACQPTVFCVLLFMSTLNSIYFSFIFEKPYCV